jgi:hypothetical protein
LDDGTIVAFTVKFRPVQDQCCGLLYDVSPPYLNLGSSPEDGGLDADDAHADAGMMNDADAAGDAPDADW